MFKGILWLVIGEWLSIAFFFILVFRFLGELLADLRLVVPNFLFLWQCGRRIHRRFQPFFLCLCLKFLRCYDFRLRHFYIFVLDFLLLCFFLELFDCHCTVVRKVQRYLFALVSPYFPLPWALCSAGLHNSFLAFFQALAILLDCLPDSQEVILDGCGEGSEIKLKIDIEVMILLWVHANKFISNIIL